MPYRDCPSCGLTLYSAAAYVTQDFCPRCNVPLYSSDRRPEGPPDLGWIGGSPDSPGEEDLGGKQRREAHG